jgi:hypothetical protein
MDDGPVTGLDPATHVFDRRDIACQEDVDARVRPGQEEIFEALP